VKSEGEEKDHLRERTWDEKTNVTKAKKPQKISNNLRLRGSPLIKDTMGVEKQ